MHHEFSHEVLTHTRCGTCRGYWSLSDAENERLAQGVHCPWCGARANLRPMEPAAAQTKDERMRQFQRRYEDWLNAHPDLTPDQKRGAAARIWGEVGL